AEKHNLIRPTNGFTFCTPFNFCRSSKLHRLWNLGSPKNVDPTSVSNLGKSLGKVVVRHPIRKHHAVPDCTIEHSIGGDLAQPDDTLLPFSSKFRQIHFKRKIRYGSL